MIFLMGPTASGKSGLALRLARRFGLEILNTDAMQLYRGLEIGTAKPTPEERASVPHHLLDLAEPDDPFSAGRFRAAALAVMAACGQRGVTPLLVGGTGLYFRAVEKGLAPIPAVPDFVAEAVRREGEARGWPALHKELAAVDPVSAARIAPGDAQRLTRALAVWRASGHTLTYWHQQPHDAPAPGPILKLALEWPREILYQRIDRRFDQMMADGLLEEVAALRRRGLSRELPAMKAVGYRQLLRHLDGETELAPAVEEAKRESRRYAKRQFTWLRQEEGLQWLDPARLEAAEERVAAFLGGKENGSQ